MEKISSFYKKYRREVIVGVVCSLVSGAIVTASEWLARAVPQAGDELWKRMINGIYCAAAQAHHDLIIVELLEFLLYGASAFLLGVVFEIIRQKIKRKVIAKRATDSNPTRVEVSNASTSYVNTNKNRIILFFSICIVTLFWTVTIIMPVNLLNKFERDIKAITPYVETSEIQFLESQWVRMTSYEDYLSIYEFINTVKQDYTLDLQ